MEPPHPLPPELLLEELDEDEDDELDEDEDEELDDELDEDEDDELDEDEDDELDEDEDDELDEDEELEAELDEEESGSGREGTQVPAPSQTLPPWSVQRVPAMTSIVPHVCVATLHTEGAQVVVLGGQSVSALHPTQLPFPSQSLPPLSVQVVPRGALAMAQQPSVQAATTHALEDPVVQLAAEVHAVHVAGAQAPSEQTWLLAHVVPHAPQFAASVRRSVQAELQDVWPVGQSHTPDAPHGSVEEQLFPEQTKTNDRVSNTAPASARALIK